MSPAPVACAPWLITAAISAAASRDVLRRHGDEPLDDRTRAQKSAHARSARLKTMSTNGTASSVWA
jgi:hypothetical protein